MLALPVIVVVPAGSVMAPVPRLRLCVPLKVKLLARLSGLLFDSVIAAAVVLSMVPPLIVKVLGSPRPSHC